MMIKNNTYTPEDQVTLDGTLWVENEIPYMVYCHEWLQIIDGTMDAVQLSPDLSEPVVTPQTLLWASVGPWSREMLSIKEEKYGLDLPGYVTDGPFLLRTKTGKLGMQWSSWGDKRYSQGVAYSSSGNMKGPWNHKKLPLNTEISGHGMLFRTFEGRLLMSLHAENLTGQGGRRPVLLEVDNSGDKLRIVSRFHS